MEIYSKGDYPANILSNFAPNSFVFDGVECASMEGFLQALKFRNVNKQLKVCALTGKDAKEAGTKKFLWKITGNVWWQGRKLKRVSEDFDKLLDAAYHALCANQEFCNALVASKGLELRHSMGKHNKRKTILTEEEFVQILTSLRNEL